MSTALVKYIENNNFFLGKKKKKKTSSIRVYIVPFIWYRQLPAYYPGTLLVNEDETIEKTMNNFFRNEKIYSYLIKYFEKIIEYKLGGVLLVSEKAEHLEKIQRRFADEFSLFLVTKWFKRKELIFDLKQKKKIVLTTYNELHYFDNLNLLQYIDTIFFVTPAKKPQIVEKIVEKLLQSSTKRRNCSIVDFLDNFAHTRNQFKKRAEFYTKKNMQLKYES